MHVYATFRCLRSESKVAFSYSWEKRQSSRMRTLLLRLLCSQDRNRQHSLTDEPCSGPKTKQWNGPPGRLPPTPSLAGLHGPSTWDFAVASCGLHLSMSLWCLLRLPSTLASAALITLWLWIPIVNIDTFTWCIIMAICRFARRHNQEEEPVVQIFPIRQDFEMS